MSARQLRDLLDRVEDTGEVVITSLRSGDWFVDELAEAWKAAETEADYALSAWNEEGGAEAYAVYLAAADRAAAAQDTLAAATATRVAA